MCDSPVYVPFIKVQSHCSVPEDDYIEDLEDHTDIQVSSPPIRITKPIMTKYEKAKILGIRASQISRNSTSYIYVNSDIVDPLVIAESELQAKALPFIIRRFLPDGQFEDFKISELTIN